MIHPLLPGDTLLVLDHKCSPEGGVPCPPSPLGLESSSSLLCQGLLYHTAGGECVSVFVLRIKKGFLTLHLSSSLRLFVQSPSWPEFQQTGATEKQQHINIHSNCITSYMYLFLQHKKSYLQHMHTPLALQKKEKKRDVWSKLSLHL